ncbi:WYL domain-containing protein [Brevibacillus formosus]|uniref:WYL domain-containing protein n=1 Tax=Brevibacillus formosus TaxID=54913 RepID=A0A220MI55_9BACL|nr:WYL domain-containing protein [Brevibacillus formosus]ASJ54757.1 WYL domain-containing protein [Brevibacillus formosus]
MNLFDKIHNYQLVTRLDEAGVYPVTSHEKAWLALMLAKPSAAEIFEPATLDKLRRLTHLPDSESTEQERFVEKAQTQAKQLWSPLVRTLRRIILGKNHIKITAATNKGPVFRNQRGVPYKLEYSLAKKAWYLIWLNMSSNRLITTPLHLIRSVDELYIEDVWYDSFLPTISEQIQQRKQMAKIVVIRRYNAELQRILYAFSCFDKEVAFDPESQVYTITLHFLSDEQEFILSRIRFLGLRVKVVENNQLKKRMAESATNALARYTETPL